MFDHDRRKWIGVVLFLGGVTAALSHWRAQVDAERAVTWPRVAGTVRGVDVIDVKATDRAYLRVSVEYAVDGQLYTTSRASVAADRARSHAEIDAFVSAHPVGSTIDVYADPEDPAMAVLDPTPPPIPFERWAAIGVALALGLGLMWLSRRARGGAEPAVADAEREHQFIARVEAVERDAARDFARHRRDVARFAAFGDVSVVGIQVATIALVVVLGALVVTEPNVSPTARQGFVVATLLAAWVTRCLWNRIPPVVAPEISRECAPELHQAVDVVRRRIDGPKVDRVVIGGTCAVALRQRPRLGVFGWTETTIELGLPLLLTASTHEVEALIAREFGRIAGASDRVRARVVRRRRFWIMFRSAIEQRRRPADGWLWRFAAWFAPELEARSIVLARAQEREAMRVMRDAAGARVAADALRRQQIVEDEMNRRYWPAAWKRVIDVAAPELVAPYAGLEAALSRDRAGVASQSHWLAEAEARVAHPTDACPDLASLLRELGESFLVPSPVRTSAAETWIGEARHDLARGLDALWVAAVAAEWSKQRARCEQRRARLADLDQAARVRKLTPSEIDERGSLREGFEGAAAALPIVEDLVQSDPHRAEYRMRFALATLTVDPARGVAATEAAMSLNLENRRRGLCALAEHAEQRGDIAEAQAYFRCVREHDAVLARARAERDLGFDRMAYAPHGLAPSDVRTLVERVRSVPGVEAAWLARKDLRYVPECPMPVLGVLRRLTADESAERRQANDVALWRELEHRIAGPPLAMPYGYYMNTLNAIDDAKLIAPLEQHAQRIL